MIISCDYKQPSKSLSSVLLSVYHTSVLIFMGVGPPAL